MSSNEERQQQEYEFVMEGITTRMQVALEKMADSNRMMSDTNKRLCRTLIIALFIVALAFLVNNVLMINHVNNLRNGVSAYETVLEQRPGADD